MTNADEFINLPLMRLMDQDGRNVWFNVSEIAAIIPSGEVPNPKIPSLADGEDIEGAPEGTPEFVPTSRIVLKRSNGAAAPVVGSPDEIVALLQSGTSASLNDVDENGYPSDLGYGD